MIKILVLLILLMSGCSNGKNQNIELKALDNFWKLLGQNSELQNLEEKDDKK